MNPDPLFPPSPSPSQVIVQMSVEFAQQTELARLAKQARETSSSMQTQPPEQQQQEGQEEKEDGEEDEEEDENNMVDGTGLPAQELQEVRRRHREEVRSLEAQLRRQTEELQALRGQLRLAGERGPDPAQTRLLSPAAAVETLTQTAMEAEEMVAWGPMARTHAGAHTKVSSVPPVCAHSCGPRVARRSAEPLSEKSAAQQAKALQRKQRKKASKKATQKAVGDVSGGESQPHELEQWQ